ncbi:RrF2 family transcriptional regulator [Kinneretia aquatilis]|uniref:RrF2 family transcriptional regulator n=1 Tax=Kinneretia aquatilis TaxID=2070761 RepID=UPI00149519E6|nr:Rrf2 family transcriptional regulator [Paucibacter aquatile]WIV96988.1 Rrf2 family transcriptional regulator [Paucibacter aquatile]
MRLTTMTDYALRMLIYLGQHPDRLCTTAEIAQAYDISEAHLTKITHQLGLGGWIRTVRGKGGGMSLALAPEDIMLGELVRAVEPDFYLVECLGNGNACSLTGRCRLTGIFNEALAAFLEQLDRHSLADLLSPAQTPASATLLGVPVGLSGLSIQPVPIKRRSRKPHEPI